MVETEVWLGAEVCSACSSCNRRINENNRHHHEVDDDAAAAAADRCSREQQRHLSNTSQRWQRRNLILATLLLFSLMFTKCYASQVLEFTVEPSDTIVPEGNSVLLQCAGRADRKVLQDDKAAPSIRWRGPDGQDIGIVGDTFRSQLTNGSLYISSVENNRGLTGFYHCLLTIDGVGTIVSRSARVSIADLPDINQESHEIYLYAGQTAYFKCMSGLLPYSVESRYKTQWLKDDLPLRMDATRMLLLPSGALEIDEVVPADRGTYQCNVTAGTFSRLSSKSNLNIKSTAGQPQSFAPPAFVIVPQPQTVREGDTVILDCAANGNPKPTIRWLRNGEDIDMNDLDSRFRIMGTGSLQINSIQDTDAGDYQCRASNTEDSLDASATVQVQVPPKFILSPDDKAAYEKEELELACAIHGKPTPIIQWLKNGDLITPNEYMQIVGGHNLKIFGLIGSDAGMFQCIGTNPAGSVQAAARLEIIEPGLPKRPKGKKFHQTQSKTKSYEKSPLLQTNPKLSKSVLDSLVSRTKERLPSGVSHHQFQYNEYTDDDYGDSDRQLDSDHDDNEDDDDDDDDDEEEEGRIYALRPNEDPNKLYQSLTGSRSRENSREVGHFSNPKSPIDAVTRKYGKPGIDGTGGRYAAPLPGPPRGLQAQIVQSRFITLSWLEPAKNPDEVISYSIYYRMHTSDRERKLTTKSRDEQEVNIQSLQPGKNYHFRVVGNSNHGSGESSEPLEVRTLSEENIAGAPQNLRGYAITERDIHLQWDPPAVTNGIITKYRVYYAETENGAEMYSDTTTTEVIINELRPYTHYTMYVVPFNQVGMGDPSHELGVKTYSSTPSEPPANVTLETTSSTSITIRWEPPPVEERNGQITGYKIKYRKNKKALQVETTPANVRYYILKDLEKMSAYQVKIAAMTINGTGPFTEWHHSETYENDLDESQVPGQPSWLKTRPGADNITVMWGPPLHQEIKVRSYILGWGKGIPDEDTAEIEENMRHFEIANLEPNSEYVISLRARNSMGDGAPKYDTVRTREDAPTEAPTPLEVPVGLRAIPMSGTSIVVYWTDTTLSKSQHVTDNRHYVVRYSPNGSNRYRYHNTTVLSSMIADLRPNTQYEFAVKVVKGHRQSAWSMSVLNSTQQASPVSPPRDLEVSFDPRNPLTAILKWQSPRYASGPIAGYHVLYTSDTAKRDRDWNLESTSGDKTYAEITALEPQTTYYFKVQTRHSKGLGPFSAMVSMKTGSEVDSNENLTLQTSISSEMIYVVAGFGVLLLVVIIAGVAVLMCRKKPEATPEHAKKSYQKNNAGIIKPPDLWIHHDQMELKNMDKGNHGTTPGSVDGGASSSGTMTLPRSVGGHDYDSETPITHVTNSLDKRSYVPGYNGTTTPLSSTMERPQYPRTQYSMAARPHITMDQTTLSQQNLLQQPPQLPPANPLAQTPENPYTYDSSYSPNVTYAQGMAVDAPKRGQGHPLKSFSVPAPPSSTPIISSQGKHGTPTPAVTIRPQNSSPYKKPSLSSGSLTNRLQTGPVVAHSNDEIQRLAPSTSTEELNQEMANLEGLMKDLSAITANEFEC
ncbi:netrin receptor DCC-like isoform X1 [Anopheles albimanus]|uniref:netrin receptor DCC-like isoform X1 n=1 Tax=Anopheles albimanus TaxID=7167 RepID=UPI001640392D|nr:netrin receptor DCC-like isoform X1 [Anopheles albimanus]